MSANTTRRAKHPRTAEEFRNTFLAGELDWEAAACRIEILLDLLTNYGIAKTVTVDRAAAAKAIKYCRRRTTGVRCYTPIERKIDAFLRAHNISIDWVFSGDWG
jgi:hypothetical protein